MKPNRQNRFCIKLLLAAASITSIAYADTVTKHTDGTDLALAASWNGGLGPAPTSIDAATWSGSSLGGPLTVGSAVNWGSIDITGASADIGITGSAITTGNLTLAGTRALTIANNIVLSGNSTYDIADVSTGSPVNPPDAILNGSVSGAFVLTKTGTGTLVLGNTSNSFTSAIVNAGILEYNCAASSVALRDTLINESGTVNLSSTSMNVDTHTLTDGSITGTGVLNKVGAGYLGTFNNFDPSGFHGQVNVLEGVLASNNNANWGNGANDMKLHVASGAAFDVRVGTVTVGELTGAGRIGTTWTGGVNLVVGNLGTDSTFSGVIENGLTNMGLTGAIGTSSLHLWKNGAGTLTLTGANTYTGQTTINGGALAVTSGGSVTTSSDIRNGDTASPTFLTISGGGTLTQSAGTTYLGINNGSSGTLAISGASSTVSLNALNLGWNTGSSGTVTISDGTLNVGATAVIGGATGGQTGSGTFTQTGGAVTFATNVLVGNQGNGTASISAGTFSQTAGIFYVGVANAGTLNVSNTASVALNQLNLGYGAAATSIINLDGGTLTIKSMSGANGVLNAAASAGTSTVNFNGGTLKAGATFNTITGVSTIVKSGGAVIDTNGFNLGMNTALTNGTGGGGLTKKSGGILTLNGANTYTGATDIQGGTLKLAAGSTIADTSTITVGSGAFLDLSDLAAPSITLGAQSLNGSGTVSGTVITGANTTIAPGMSPGTLTITGGLNAAAGSTFNFELGATSDSLAIGGVLTGSTNPSDLNFNFSDAGGILTGTTYDLFTFASSSGLEVTDLEALILPAGLTLDPSFGTGGWNITGNNLQVQFIPEPASALLGSLGLLALLRRRRN